MFLGWVGELSAGRVGGGALTCRYNERVTETLPRFEDILDFVSAYNPDCDEDLLRRAYVYSAMAHRGQVRVSGEPYLVHPLEVARILAEMHLDEVAIAGGLLHDLLEDTWVTEEELEEQFGEHITGLVKALTKITTMEQSYAAREAAQAENVRRMLLASIADVRVILVKLADRLHNMRTLGHLPEDRRKRIAAETMEIYAPIAHRLGMGRIKAELEDLALAYQHPEEHLRLAEELGQREELASSMIADIRGAITRVLEENSINAEVRGRIKHLHSIWTKLRRQGIGLDRVYDFLAVRLIVDTVPHCYAALGLIHQLWRPVPGRIKDYIAMPKPNAYQSLHTSVIGPEGQPFEVQIRTPDMDEIAERGIAAHWLYKEGREPSHDAERVSWLRSLVEGQQENPREFLNSLKLNLYPEEVYTFTPKGEVFAFARGATPIDFAYRVHTEVGNHCVGARINGKLVPLRTALQNGDIVEILTSPNQVPSRDWIEIAVTGRAQNKIRAWLNRGEKEQAVEAGRRLLERECRRLGISLKHLREEGKLAQLASDHGFGREEDLVAAFGFGRLSLKDVLAPFARARTAAPAAAPAPGRARGGAGGRLGHHGARPARPAYLPRAVLHPAPRRRDHRVRHAGARRRRPRGALPEREEAALHRGARGRGRVGRGGGRLRRAAARRLRGSPRHARGDLAGGERGGREHPQLPPLDQRRQAGNRGARRRRARTRAPREGPGRAPPHPGRDERGDFRHGARAPPAGPLRRSAAESGRVRRPPRGGEPV